MKKNKIILSLLASSVLSTCLFASTDTVALEQEIKILKEEMKILKEEINANSKINDTLIEKAQETTEAIIDMEERSDDIEASTLADKISWGLTMNQDADYISYKFTNGDVRSNVDFYSRVRLNMKSDFAENMQFFGRLSMVKDWGSGFIEHQINNYSDVYEGRRTGSSAVYMERAYVKWAIAKDSNLPMTLSVGRLPSSDGPSIQFKENTTRKSMVSALAFDGASDGIEFTLNTDHYLKLHGSKFKIGYSRYIQDNTTGEPLSSSDTIKNTEVAGLFFQTKLGKNSPSEFSISYVQAFDLYNSQGQNMGDVGLITSYLEFPNLYKSGLTAFIHGVLSTAMPSGNITAGETLLGTAANSSKNINGWAVWAGVRYKFDAPEYNNPRVGFEFNHGSQNFISFTPGSNDNSEKLSTRGNVYEVYYTQPINRHAFVRLSAQYQDVTNVGKSYNVVGTPYDVDSSPVNTIESEIYAGISLGIKF